MKNVVFIDVDTEREKIVQIGKPADSPKPANPDEAKKMILDDISCTCEGLCTLIHIADQNKYSTKEELIKAAVKHLNDMLITSVKT